MENKPNDEGIYLPKCSECKKEILLDKHHIIIDEDEMEGVYHRECYLKVLRLKSPLPLVTFDLEDVSGLKKRKFTKKHWEKNKERIFQVNI